MKYITEEEMNRQIERYERINVMKERKMAVDEVKNRYKIGWHPFENVSISNRMLIVSVIMILAYTIACFFLTYATSVNIDSTLTTCFFTFFSGEIFLLAGIKVSKVIKKAPDEEEDLVDIDLADYDFSLDDDMEE